MQKLTIMTLAAVALGAAGFVYDVASPNRVDSAATMASRAAAPEAPAVAMARAPAADEARDVDADFSKAAFSNALAPEMKPRAAVQRVSG